MALVGVHPAAAKPVVQTLLEGRAPSDPEAPCVRVCVSPHELLEVPVGARVVLLNAVRAAEWLNLNRPVVSERGLAMFLWLTTDEWTELRAAAPDFVDWVSHRVVVPRFGPAMDELRRALRGSRWVAVLDRGVATAAFPETDAVWLDPTADYEDVRRSMEAGPVVLRGPFFGRRTLMQYILTHTMAGWQHPVVLVEPKVIPLMIRVVPCEENPWRSPDDFPAGRLEASLEVIRMTSISRALEEEDIEVIDFPRTFHRLVALVDSQDPDLECLWIAAKLGLFELTVIWLLAWIKREGIQADWTWTPSNAHIWASAIFPQIAYAISQSRIVKNQNTTRDLALREAIRSYGDFAVLGGYMDEDVLVPDGIQSFNHERLQDLVDSVIRRLSHGDE